MITNIHQHVELEESEKEDFLKYMNRKTMFKNESNKSDSNLSNGAYIRPLHTFSTSHYWIKRSLLVFPGTQELVYVSGSNLIVETESTKSQHILSLKLNSEVTSLFQSSNSKGRYVIVGEKVSDKDNYYSYSNYGRVEIFNLDKLNTNEERKFLDHSYYINYPHFVYDAISIRDTELCLTIVKNIDTDETDTKIFIWDFDTISLLTIQDFDSHIENIVISHSNKMEFIFYALYYCGIWEYSLKKNKFICTHEFEIDSGEISDCAYLISEKFNGVILSYNSHLIEIYDKNNGYSKYRSYNLYDVYSNLGTEMVNLSFFRRVSTIKKSLLNTEPNNMIENIRKSENDTVLMNKDEAINLKQQLLEKLSGGIPEKIQSNNSILEVSNNNTFIGNHDKENIMKNLKLTENENHIKYVIVRKHYIFVFFVNTSIYFTLKIEDNNTDKEEKSDNKEKSHKLININLIKIDRLAHDVLENSCLMINETMTDFHLITGATYKTQFMVKFQNVKRNIFKQQKKDRRQVKEDKKRGDHVQQRVKKSHYKYKIKLINDNEIPHFKFDSIILPGSSSGQEIKNIAVSENPRFIVSGFQKKYITVHQQFGQNEVNSHEFVHNIKNLLTNYDINPYVSTYNLTKEKTNFSFVNEKIIEGEATSISINPQGSHFFISYSGMASLFAIMENEIKEVSKIKTQSCATAFSHSGNYLAFSWEESEGDYSILIMDINTYEIEYMIKKIPMPIKIIWMDDDRKIIVLFNDTSTNIVGWTLGDKRIIQFVHKESSRENSESEKKKQRKRDMIFKLSDRPEKIIDFVYDHVIDYLLITTEDKRVKIFRPQIKDDVYLEFGSEIRYSTVMLLRKLDIIIFGTCVGSIRILLWPISNYTLLQQIDHPEYTEKYVHSDKVSSIFVTSDLKFLYSGSADGSVFISTLNSVNNDRDVNIQTFVHFNSQNILPRKMKMDYSDLIYLTDAVYQSKLEIIEKKETELLTIDSEAVQEMEKTLNQNGKKLEKKRNAINKEIEIKRRAVKNLEELKESNSKLLKEKRENQIKLFKQEIRQIKTEFKNVKEEMQLKTKNLNSIIKETNLNFSSAVSEIENKIKIDNEQKIKKRLEIQLEELLEKFYKIEKMIEDKKNSFNTELNSIEYIYEEKIRKHEHDIRRGASDQESKIKELEIEISKTKKYNKNYNEKISEWETHLMELNNNTADLTEIYLFNLLKLKQMYNSLKENEKKISENESTAKQKRSVNDRLEQLRYVLEYQIKNLIKEKVPIEEQIKNFDILNNDFYKRFNILYSEQLKIDEFITNNDNLISEFKKQLVNKKSVLYSLKNVFKAVETEIHRIFKDKLVDKQDLLSKLNGIYDFYLRRDYTDNDDETLITEEKKLQAKFIEREVNKQKNKVLQDLIHSRQKMKEVRKQKEDIMLKIRLENENLIEECSNIRMNLEDILKHITDIEKKFIELTNTHLFLNKNINTKLIKNNFKIAKQRIMLGDDEKTKIAKGNINKDDTRTKSLIPNLIDSGDKPADLTKQIDENKAVMNVQNAEIERMQLMIEELIGHDYKSKKGLAVASEEKLVKISEKKIPLTQPITSINNKNLENSRMLTIKSKKYYDVSVQGIKDVEKLDMSPDKKKKDKNI